MIINLNSSIEIKEFAEIIVTGVSSENCRVDVTFSKEALIGFATNLIWTYEDIDINKKFHVHIDPLGGNPSGNQAMGFFLTSQSPSLVVQVNGIDNNDHLIDKKNIYKEIDIRKEILTNFEIKEPASEESIEEYELGYKNIADIKVYNQYDLEMTNDCIQVVLKLNYEGLKDFATMLLILANNYKNKCGYLLAHMKQNELQYNIGILLSESSCEMKINCDELETVYDYEPSFGLMKL